LADYLEKALISLKDHRFLLPYESLIETGLKAVLSKVKCLKGNDPQNNKHK
jgi:hypothetical protein